MALELIDFRGKVTPETNAVLEALNRVTGKDKSELAREVLHKWASEQIGIATVLDTMMRAEGLTGLEKGK